METSRRQCRTSKTSKKDQLKLTSFSLFSKLFQDFKKLITYIRYTNIKLKRGLAIPGAATDGRQERLGWPPASPRGLRTSALLQRRSRWSITLQLAWFSQRWPCGSSTRQHLHCCQLYTQLLGLGFWGWPALAYQLPSTLSSLLPSAFLLRSRSWSFSVLSPPWAYRRPLPWRLVVDIGSKIES